MHARFRDPTVLQMGRPTHLPARGPVSVWCMTGGVSVSEKRCTPARARVPTDTTKTGSSYESHAASPTLTAHQPYSVAPTPGPLLQIPFFFTPRARFPKSPATFPKFRSFTLPISTQSRSHEIYPNLLAAQHAHAVDPWRFAVCAVCAVCVYACFSLTLSSSHASMTVSQAAHSGCACLFAKAPSSRGPTANSLASSRH